MGMSDTRELQNFFLCSGYGSKGASDTNQSQAFLFGQYIEKIVLRPLGKRKGTIVNDSKEVGSFNMTTTKAIDKTLLQNTRR